MTLPRRLFLLAVVVVLAGCGKPNPRIAKIFEDKANDSPDETIEFSYDDQGRVNRVERTEGNDSQVWELTWDGALLAKISVREEEDGDLEETESELTWENGKLVSSKTTVGNNETDVTYRYDDQGRFAGTDSEGDDQDSTATVNYDDDGLIASLESESDSNGSLTKTEIEFDRDGQQITTLALSQEGNEVFAVDLDYDEDPKRLLRSSFDFEIVSGGENVVVTSISSFFYADNGLLETIERTAEVQNTETDVSEVEITYDEGDASSLDITPNEIFLFGIFFDMKGFSHGTIDNTTGVPRTAFPSW